MDTEAYARRRLQNNAAARRSRQVAKERRAKRSWLSSRQAGLTRAEQIAARSFLAGSDDVTLTPEACDAIRKHLIARQGTANARMRLLIRRLDQIEEK